MTQVRIKLIEQLLDAENRRALLPEYEGDHRQGKPLAVFLECNRFVTPATLHSGTMSSSIMHAGRPSGGEPAALSVGAATAKDCLAFATAKSFGDFVIAHSVLHRVEGFAKDRLRLISNSHVKALSGILPDNVCVTLVDSESERVPALFDIKKRGAVAGVKSAWSLRREFHKIERRHNEMLAFAARGMRERFIAGGWPVIYPRMKGSKYL